MHSKKKIGNEKWFDEKSQQALKIKKSGNAYSKTCEQIVYN